MKAVHFRLSIPMAPFWSKGNFAHHFISARFHKCFYIPNFGAVVDSPEVRTSNLRDRWWRSWSWTVPEFGMSQCTKLWDCRWRSRRFDVLTSGPSPTVPKFKMYKYCWNIADIKLWAKLPFDQKGAIGMKSLKWTAFDRN